MIRLLSFNSTLVQLKALESASDDAERQSFNSTLVQLKDMAKRTTILPTLVSILP